ncbi:hypothetical protein ABBQ38_012955 [Trebouxia sp. C0009 RCD-2024]
MAHIQQQNHPSFLTTELWAKVFRHLDELLDNVIPKQHQAEMHQLKLVCKQFRETFSSHSGLVERLYLGYDLSAGRLPRLLAWLKKNKSSIQILHSKCESSVFEIVLTEVGIHMLGLSACTALTHLVFSDASLELSDGHMYLGRGLWLFPDNLHLLGQLHTLELNSIVRADSVISNVIWISTLTSLKDLSICFHNTDTYVIRHALLLTNLTRLHILAQSRVRDVDVDDQPVLSIAMAWHKLQALQDLSICGFSLQPTLVDYGFHTRGVAGLLRLPHLRVISFAGCTTLGEYHSECFAALIYNLARLRPEVKLVGKWRDFNNFFTSC